MINDLRFLKELALFLNLQQIVLFALIVLAAYLIYLYIKHKLIKQRIILKNYRINLVNKIKQQINNANNFNEIIKTSAWTELSKLMTSKEKEAFGRIMLVVGNPTLTSDEIKLSQLLSFINRLENKLGIK